MKIHHVATHQVIPRFQNLLGFLLTHFSLFSTTQPPLRIPTVPLLRLCSQRQMLPPALPILALSNLLLLGRCSVLCHRLGFQSSDSTLLYNLNCLPP